MCVGGKRIAQADKKRLTCEEQLLDHLLVESLGAEGRDLLHAFEPRVILAVVMLRKGMMIQRERRQDHSSRPVA